MSERTKHSKSAIASIILPLAVWVYLSVMFALVFKSSLFEKAVNYVFGDSYGALGVAFLLFIILFGFVPFAGHLAGLICGALGLASKDRKKTSAVVGLILNILPFAVGLILYGIGYQKAD